MPNPGILFRLVLALLGVIMSVDAHPESISVPERVETYRMAEWRFTAQKPSADPFNTLTVDAVFTTPWGGHLKVPAFWAGGNRWCVRYSSGNIGKHTFRLESSDRSDPGLQGQTGSVEVVAYHGANPLFIHGPVRVARTHGSRYFEHVDGTPFLWLGDTWWFGLSKRLSWPEDFHHLTSDRKSKGFNVVQIVAGLYPELAPLDPNCENEAGLPWEPGFERVRPEYFDLADRRIEYLVDNGITPCIVGAWGYFMPVMGAHKLAQHWRYLIARYGALPTIWCVAGEVNLPYYHAPNFPFDDVQQAHAWMDVVRYVRDHDPYRRPLTVHPTGLGKLNARGTADASLLDYDMLQTGHGGINDLGVTVKTVHNSYTTPPAMPVVQGEVNYEALLGTNYNPDSIQRLFYWSCMLSGTTGYTYGGNGIWQVNLQDKPRITYGNYAVPTWQAAMKLPGSTEVGIGHKILMGYPWQRMSPHPEWAAFVPEPKLKLDGCRWIWYPAGNPSFDAPVGKRWFRRTFTMPAGKAVRSARLKMTADDKFTVWLNGKEIGSHANWKTGRLFEGLEGLLKSGWNTIAVEAENGAASAPNNPAGLIGLLQVDYRDGTSDQFRTDALWKCSKEALDGWNLEAFTDTRWSQALATAVYGDAPWGLAAEGGEQAAPFCAGIPGELRVAYLPMRLPVLFQNLEPGHKYQVTWIDPITGKRTEAGSMTVGTDGNWTSPVPPQGPNDRVLVLNVVK